MITSKVTSGDEWTCLKPAQKQQMNIGNQLSGLELTVLQKLYKLQCFVSAIVFGRTSDGTEPQRLL